MSTNIFLLFSNHLASNEITRSPVYNPQPTLLTCSITNSKLCIIINNCIMEQENLKSFFEELNFQVLLCNNITHSDIHELFNVTTRIQELTVLAVFILSEGDHDVINGFEGNPIEQVLVAFMNHMFNTHKTDKLVFVQTICFNGDYDISKPVIQLCIPEKCIYFHISTKVSIIPKFINIFTAFPNCSTLKGLSQLSSGHVYALLSGHVYVKPKGYDFILNSMERYV